MSKKSNLKAIRRLQDKEYDYSCWIEENESKRELSLKHKPLFSLVIFKENATEKQKKRCIRSVKEQDYDEIESIVISEKTLYWSKIKEQIHGEYVIFISMRDWLSPNSLCELSHVFEKNPDAQWVYSDEDTWNEENKKRIHPKFKPEWSYDTFLSFFYTGNLSAYKTEMAKKIKDWDSEYSAYWQYDFALRFLEVCNQKEIYHISKVLYHQSSESRAKKQQKKSILNEIKNFYLERNHIKAKLEVENRTGEMRVVYEATGSVSIVIPSKDNPEMLLKCIDSIKEYTDYANYEIVVIDNGSNYENQEILEKELCGRTVKYIYEKMDFNFSKMCNIGAKQSKADYILFLNDDIECIDSKWLERMLGQAAQPGVGAVGAKLLYPSENKIQHTGVVNLEFGPSHILTRQKDEGVLADGRNCLDYNFEAVTAACLLIKRSHYETIHGFDEKLPVAYNDVDFCYCLREQNLRNVLRTDAVLIHHESISRGLDVMDDAKMIRLEKERSYLYEKHPRIIEKGDAFYNENFSMERTDFSLSNPLDFKKYNTKIRQKLYTNKPFTVIIDKINRVKDLHITGWFWFKNDDYTNYSDVFMVFKNEKTGKEIWYEVTRQFREDVTEVLNNHAVYCGFACKVVEDEVEVLQNCKVGLCVQMYNLKLNLMTWADVVID